MYGEKTMEQMKTGIEADVFNAIADASSMVYVYATDMQTGVTRWSKLLVDYLNLESEYTTDPLSVFGAVIHPEDVAMWQEDIEAVFAGKKNHHRVQYRIKNRYGEYVWVECNGTMIYNEEGNEVLFAGILTRLDVQNRYDPQTNMLTMVAFYADDIKKNGAGTALLLNMDGSRELITTYGYAASKELVGIVAGEMKDICDASMKIYRMGPDAFMIVLPGGTVESTRTLYNSIADKLRVLRLSSGSAVRISISGAAVKYPEDCMTQEDILEKLDCTMEYAKKHQTGRLVFYSSKIAEEQTRRSLLQEDLINCVQNDFEGFRLFYQPLVEPSTGKIIGSESLLRWQGKVIKDSYPMEFIDVLEETGYIRQVGLWVMEQTLLQKKAWEEKFGDLQMSFNVSYQQFMDKDFAAKVIAKADELEVNAENVIVELTESCQVKDPESLASVFEVLGKHGFKIALDDFGTAYASMDMLRKLPVDYIKIDHTFVRELANEGHDDDYIIVEELVRMTNRLRHGAIIEGVENEQVVEKLKDVEAHLLQGYHFSKPVSKEEFEALLVG